MKRPGLVGLGKTALRRFAAMRKACDARVVRRELATWHLWSFEPYYFERNQFTRGRRLARKPAPKVDCLEYGWDADDIPARVRDWSGFLRRWHEEELAVRVDASTIDVYRVRADGAELLNIHRYHFDRERRLTLHECLFAGAGRIGRARYSWGDGLLRRVDITNWGGDRHEVLEYDDDGLLQTVSQSTSKGTLHAVYQRPPRSEALPELLAQIADRLVAVVPRAIRDAPRSIALVLDDDEHRHVLPPELAVAAASGRITQRPIRDADLARMCTRANQHIWQRGRHAAAHRMLKAVVRRLAAATGLPVRLTTLGGPGSAD